MPPKFRINYNVAVDGADGADVEPLEYDKHFTKKTRGFRTKNSSYFKAIVSFKLPEASLAPNVSFFVIKIPLALRFLANSISVNRSPIT